jgi:hypothetical protein
VATAEANDTKSASQKPYRYNLSLPIEIWEELERAAAKRHLAVADVLREFIRLGLLAIQIEETPGSSIIFREGDVDTQVRILSFVPFPRT